MLQLQGILYTMNFACCNHKMMFTKDQKYHSKNSNFVEGRWSFVCSGCVLYVEKGRDLCSATIGRWLPVSLSLHLNTSNPECALVLSVSWLSIKKFTIAIQFVWIYWSFSAIATSVQLSHAGSEAGENWMGCSFCMCHIHLSLFFVPWRKSQYNQRFGLLHHY